MYNNNKYYSNYDKNIKSIKGSGVITPSNPPNKTKTTNSINNIWDDEIIPTPPLNKLVYYSDKNLTSGYLNENNYVVKNQSISDYYYPSQKFDKVINLKNNKKKIKIQKIKLNDTNQIKLNDTNQIKLNDSNQIKLNDANQIKLNDANQIKLNDTNQIKLNDANQIKLQQSFINSKYSKNNNNDLESIKFNKNKYIEYIINNTIYDGKFIYTLEDKPIYIDNKQNYKIINLPYLYNSNNKQSNQNIDDLYENFHKNISNSNKFEISNNILLIIFSILLIFYFTIYQKI